MSCKHRQHIALRSWGDGPRPRWTGSLVSKASMIPAGQPGHEHGNNGATRQPARRSAESETRLVEKRHGSRERSSRISSSDKTVSRYMCST